MSESQHKTQFAIAVSNYAIIEFGIRDGQTLTSGYVVGLQLLALIRGFISEALQKFAIWVPQKKRTEMEKRGL